MSVEVVMPKMGESIQEGKVLRWVKKVGDKVERDETLLEISTDKVDTEVPSPVAGTILQILVAENDTVEVGKVLAVIGADNEVAAAPAPAAPAPAAAAPAPAAPAAAAVAAPAAPAAPAPGGNDIEVVMPKMGESIQEGKVLRWVKKVGDAVERDETLLEISTDKVDTEVPSPIAGTLSAILANEGDVVEVGKAIARITSGAAAQQAAPSATPAPPTQQAAPSAAPAAPATPAASAEPTQAAKPAANGAVKIQHAAVANAATSSIPRTSGSRFYSPLVRSIAAVEGLTVAQLDAIAGTGLEGRVTKTDVMSYLQGARPTSSAAAPQVAPAAPAAAPSAGGTPTAAPASQTQPAVITTESGFVGDAEHEVIPMDRIRQLTAEHMVRSKQTSPHVTSVAEADVTGMVKLREKSKDAFQSREGFKLTYNPFFAIAAAEAAKQYPRINVSVDGKNIIQHRRVHLGMATALPDGNLIVPVVKNADVLNVTGMARAMNDLANRARTKKLKPDDISGGTLTVTNVGSFGSLFGTPVINQPQTAIIGIGAIQKRPVVKEVDGEDFVVVRHMVYVSITYDHRVIDGALATQALAAMMKSLESMNATTVAL